MLQQIKQLMLGNGLAQLLQFGSILILSRVYQPSDFGILASVQALAMVGSILITLQLHLTIPLSNTQDVALRTVLRVQNLSLILFLTALLPSIWFGGILVYALVLSLFLGLTNAYTGYLVYSGSFRRMSFFYVLRAALIILMQISFSYIEIENGLVLATLFGEALSAFYLRMIKIKSIGDDKINIWSIKQLIVNNKAFSLYGTVQEIVSVSAFYSPLFMFSYKYGEEIGGQYAMASRLIWAPVVLVSSSIAQVLSHNYGKQHYSGSLDLTWHLRSNVLGLLALACLAGFTAQPVFHSILGEPWEMASQLLPIQLLWGVAFIMSTPFRVACRVYRLQGYQLLADALALAAIVSLLMSLELSPLQAMWVIAGLSLLQHAGFSLAIWRFSNQRKNDFQ